MAVMDVVRVYMVDNFEQNLRDTANIELARLEKERAILMQRVEALDSEIALFKGMATMPSYGIELLRRRVADRQEEPKEPFFKPGI